MYDEGDGVDPAIRSSLRQWLEVEVEPSFADRVAQRWQSEQAVQRLEGLWSGVEPELAAGVRASRTRRRRRERWMAAGAAVACAAGLALLLGARGRVGADGLSVLSGGAVARLEQQATAALVRQCNPCHSGMAAEGSGRATQAFDLDDPRWFAKVSRARLEQIGNGFAEVGGAEDVAMVRGLVAMELGRR